jgi:hypothetical protein
MTNVNGESWAYVTEHFAELGISPISGNGLYNDILHLFESEKKEFPGSKRGIGSITDRVANHILEETGILARIIKPGGSLRPEWYDDSILASESLLNRGEFEDISVGFQEMFEIDRNMGDVIMLYIGVNVKNYEKHIYDFYQIEMVTKDIDEDDNSSDHDEEIIVEDI